MKNKMGLSEMILLLGISILVGQYVKLKIDENKNNKDKLKAQKEIDSIQLKLNGAEAKRSEFEIKLNEANNKIQKLDNKNTLLHEENMKLVNIKTNELKVASNEISKTLHNVHAPKIEFQIREFDGTNLNVSFKNVGSFKLSNLSINYSYHIRIPDTDLEIRYPLLNVDIVDNKNSHVKYIIKGRNLLIPYYFRALKINSNKNLYLSPGEKENINLFLTSKIDVDKVKDKLKKDTFDIECEIQISTIEAFSEVVLVYIKYMPNGEFIVMDQTQRRFKMIID